MISNKYHLCFQNYKIFTNHIINMSTVIFFLFTGRINIITSNRIKCFCNNSKYFNFVPHKNSGVWEGKLSSNIHWIDVQNCIVESSINNIYVIKSNIFLYACKCLSHFRYPVGFHSLMS